MSGVFCCFISVHQILIDLFYLKLKTDRILKSNAFQEHITRIFFQIDNKRRGWKLTKYLLLKIIMNKFTKLTMCVKIFWQYTYTIVYIFQIGCLVYLCFVVVQFARSAIIHLYVHKKIFYLQIKNCLAWFKNYFRHI